MKVIEKLENFIDSEIHDAEVYAKCALKYKESDPTLAKLFYDLSTEEMRHMDLLHGEVVRQIEQYRKTKGEPRCSPRRAIYYNLAQFCATLHTTSSPYRAIKNPRKPLIYKDFRGFGAEGGI